MPFTHYPRGYKCHVEMFHFLKTKKHQCSSVYSNFKSILNVIFDSDIESSYPFCSKIKLSSRIWKRKKKKVFFNPKHHIPKDKNRMKKWEEKDKEK